MFFIASGTVCAAVTLVVAAYGYMIHVGVEGTGELRRGDFKFALLVSPPVQETPVVDACDDPVFVEYGRDGTRAPYATIRYASRASLRTLDETFGLFALQYECTRTGPHDGAAASGDYECDDHEVTSIRWTAEAGPQACVAVSAEIGLNY